MLTPRTFAFAALMGLTTSFITQGASAAPPAKRATAAERASFKASLAAGRKAVKAKVYKKAIAEFTAALAIVPSSASVLGELGWAYFLDGQLEPAEKHTAKAIEISVRAKQLGALHYNSGRIAEALGKKDEARYRYTESLSYRENDAVRKRVDALGGPRESGREVDGHATFKAALGDNAYCGSPTHKPNASEDARCTWADVEDETLVGGGIDQVRVVVLEGSADDIGGSVDVAAVLLRKGKTWFNAKLLADSWTPGMDYISNNGEIESFQTGDLLPDVPGSEVLIIAKESSVDHDPGVEMTTSDMHKAWHLCGMVDGTVTCVDINYEVEWESNELEGESWDAGKKLDGQKWAIKVAIEGSTIVITTDGKVGDLPPDSQACLGRHTFAQLSKKACANATILK